jgi:hypothetical protein
LHSGSARRRFSASTPAISRKPWIPLPRGELRITRTNFRELVRLNYAIQEQKLRAERQTSPWDQSLVYMHFRGGYHQPLFLNKVWGFFVDLTCAVILIWIASGFIMWWRLERQRLWGILALGGGTLSFLAFVWAL